MRNDPEYRHIGHTYNQAAADKRNDATWIFISMGGMVLLGLCYWAFTIIYDSYK